MSKVIMYDSAEAARRPGPYIDAEDYGAIAARLADESREHADTLCHNAEMGAALVDCRARLAECERHREKNRETALQYQARLAEAERLLERAVADDFDDADVESIYDFLRPADSATGQESDIHE